MKDIKLLQDKPLKVMLVGYSLLIIAILAILVANTPWLQIMMLIGIGIGWIGYNGKYIIRKNFENTKEITLFGLPIIRFKMNIEFPDYISVFSASMSNSTEWSTVSVLVKRDKTERVVLRFFTENRHFTVFSTNKYKEALKKGEALSELLGIERNNTLAV